MKELKEYTLSLFYVDVSGLVGMAMVALITGYVAILWWVMRFIWNYFLEI